MLYLTKDIRRVDDAKRYLLRASSLDLAPEQQAVVGGFSRLITEGVCERYLANLERMIAATQEQRKMRLTCKSHRSNDESEERITIFCLQVNYPDARYVTKIATAYHPWTGVRHGVTLMRTDEKNSGAKVFPVIFEQDYTHDDAMKKLERLPLIKASAIEWTLATIVSGR